MILIFEGHDKAGKSTIAKSFASIFGHQYFKHGRQANSFYQKHNREFIFYEALLLLDFLSQVKVNVVIDRHIPSEYVYGVVNKREINFDLIKKIDTKWADLGAKLVICEKQYFKEDEFSQEELLEESKLDEVKKYFRLYSEITAMKCLVLDTTSHDTLDHAQQIRKFIES